MKNNRGVTLVALVVTVIVLLILTAVSINGIINTGVIDQTRDVSFKTKAKDIKDAWDSRIIGVDSTFLEYSDLTDILSETNADPDLLAKLEVQNGDLVYKDDMCTEEEKEWFRSVGIFGGISIIADVKTNVRVIGEEVPIVREQGIDAAFVVDFSGSTLSSYSSSNKKTRLNVMASTLNTTIKKILERNPKNRISIVGFNDNADIMLPLDAYRLNYGSKYVEYYQDKSGSKARGNIRTFDSSSHIFLKNSSGSTVKASYNGVEDVSGTYIQSGIYKGYEVLSSRPNKENLPVMILFTDGAPNKRYYNIKDYSKFGPKILTDFETTSDPFQRALDTIRTAVEAKYRLKDSRFYTINITEYTNQIDKCLAECILNPSPEALDRANKATGKSNASDINYMTASQLKTLVSYVRSEQEKYPDKNFNYSDGFSLGALSEDQLNEMFDNFITDIEQNLEKTYTVVENTTLSGVYEVDSDNLSYRSDEGQYNFKLEEDENVLIRVKAAAYKKATTEGAKPELVEGTEFTTADADASIPIQSIKDGVDPNIYYLDGTIKWNLRSEYKDAEGLAAKAIAGATEKLKAKGINYPNDAYEINIVEVVFELPVSVEEFIPND